MRERDIEGRGRDEGRRRSKRVGCGRQSKLPLFLSSPFSPFMPTVSFNERAHIIPTATFKTITVQ